MNRETIAKKILNVNWKRSTFSSEEKGGRIKTVANQPAAKFTKSAEKTLSQGGVKNLAIETKLAKTGEKVNKALEDYLKRQKANILLNEIQRLILAGGKRLRPALFYYGYKVCGGRDEELVIDIGAALELFHTFALIHDDVLDKSLLRRGQPTVNARLGDDKAILIGDFCFNLANELFFQTLLRAKLSFPTLKKMGEIWEEMQKEVIFGEYLDIDLAKKLPDSIRGVNQIGRFLSLEREVLKMLEYKSGRYTIERPLHLAASLVKAPKEIFTAFSKYGRNLGIAFQIKDDILGIFGEEKIIGKPADSDLKEGKMTLLMVKFWGKLRGKCSKKDNDRYKKLNDLDWVRKKMRETGVLAECEKQAEKLVQKAKKAMQSSSLREKDKEFFLELTDYVVRRRY